REKTAGIQFQLNLREAAAECSRKEVVAARRIIMEKFNQLPFLARFVIFAVVGAAIFAGAWYGPVPGFEAMRAANDASIAKLKVLQAENARMKPYESQLKEIELQIESLQRQMDRQKENVPDQKTGEQLMHNMQQHSQQSVVVSRVNKINMCDSTELR